MSDEWVIVSNWDRFQHYGDRDPVWVKVYLRLLHDDDWLALTDAEKGFLLTIWLEFASTGGQIRASRVPTRLRPVNVARTLERLSHAGFIELSAIKPLALTRSREKILREEKEEDALAHARASTDAPARAPKNKTQDLEQAAKDLAAGWQGGSSADFDDQLDSLERDLGGRLSALARGDLWDLAFNHKPKPPADQEEDLF